MAIIGCASGAYGWLGVEIFFVISGFVIPLSILQSYERFSLSDFPEYMMRRLVRLEPPYLLSILLVVILWELSALAPGFAGAPPDWSFWQILSHVGYVIPLTPFAWLQPVYWTLAYEFVFYLLAAAFFPVFSHAAVWRWLLAVGAVSGLCLVGMLPPLSLLFPIGIAVFRRIALKDPLWVLAMSMILAGGSLAILGKPLEAAAGSVTALVILATAHVRLEGSGWRPFFWLGSLSYSIYLLHLPIGGRVVNLSRRFLPETTWAEFSMSCVGLLLSLAAAAVFWRLVECPAIHLSRQMSKRPLASKP
ncbi:acyltransferase [uncultured Pelagimonas sp.]|uniref:acyltransferase family protein n=1 Tax=uncultured Pelagimonas sp. TaxID=1618102 RepID=UPI0026377817|nr:acyltransferase [uncultured Pelagimonas sp.]